MPRQVPVVSQFDSRAAEQSEAVAAGGRVGDGSYGRRASCRPARTARRCLAVLRTREVRLPGAIPDPPACCILIGSSGSFGCGAARLRASRSLFAAMDRQAGPSSVLPRGAGSLTSAMRLGCADRTMSPGRPRRADHARRLRRTRRRALHRRVSRRSPSQHTEHVRVHCQTETYRGTCRRCLSAPPRVA